MFVVALILGAVLLRGFRGGAVDRRNTSLRCARPRQLAEALNATLRSSPDPQQTLQAFGQLLGTRRCNQVPDRGNRFSGCVWRRTRHTASRRAPGWFVDFLALPEMRAAFPVVIDGKRVATSCSIRICQPTSIEKWIGFLAILGFVASPWQLLTGIIAYATAGAALGPLHDLGEGLTRMRHGQLRRGLIPPAGPPEIRRSAEEANALARNLEPAEPGQPQPVAQDRVAAGRRAARSGTGTS